jgi:hypothetical protein
MNSKKPPSVTLRKRNKSPPPYHFDVVLMFLFDELMSSAYVPHLISVGHIKFSCNGASPHHNPLPTGNGSLCVSRKQTATSPTSSIGTGQIDG